MASPLITRITFIKFIAFFVAIWGPSTVKVAQCIQVDENRRYKEEAKKVTENKIATRKVHLKLKISEAFYRCIHSMNSLFFLPLMKKV